MKSKKEENVQDRSESEVDRIAAKTLKNLLSTPPKPFTKPTKRKAKIK